MFNSPFIVYYEGSVALNDVVYEYTLSESTIVFSGYRVLCRSVDVGASATVNFLKNGTLLYQLTINSTDSGDLSFPKIAFSSGDVFSLVVSSVTGTLQGLTFLFDVSVSYAVVPDLESLQIETPLIFRYEGMLVQNEVFFSYTTEEQLQFFGYGIQLREAADANVTLGVYNNGTQVSTLLLTSGSTHVEGTIDFYAAVGDTITLKVLTIGSNANPGASMIGYLNVQSIAKTLFSQYQTPFILEYEGLASSESTSLFRYTAPRDFTVFLLQAFVRSTSSSNLVFGLFQNGNQVATVTVPAGQSQSVVNSASTIALSVTDGDLLETKYLSGDPTAGILVTMDYFLSQANETQNYVFYSDPDQEIILIARQVGIGGKKADAISCEQLAKYKQDVNNLLNARLTALYRTPLRKVNNGSSPWPEPIQFIAQRLVLRYLLADIYSEVEPNASSNIGTQATIAEGLLKQLQDREFLLRGQSLRSRDYGSNPYTEPLFVNNPNSIPPITPNG